MASGSHRFIYQPQKTLLNYRVECTNGVDDKQSLFLDPRGEVLWGLGFLALSWCNKNSVVEYMEWICERLLWDAFIDGGGIRDSPIR
ncbi:hypothetical protein OPV22_023882 [Ensete ventricosum]|uniref:Uncharacterized protein n=1 Tax=Ensete ventricosum TaxID=4639 RepID=A0AAV8PDD3_ENSVE|nr:hypothetical protein OPV22_023882 [Ensete ventricosum]